MACNCGRGKTAIKVTYEVTFRDGTKKPYKTSLEANAAARRAGGGTVRAKQEK